MNVKAYGPVQHNAIHADDVVLVLVLHAPENESVDVVRDLRIELRRQPMVRLSVHRAEVMGQTPDVGSDVLHRTDPLKQRRTASPAPAPAAAARRRLGRGEAPLFSST